NGPSALAIADLDGDGLPDALASGDGGELALFASRGDGFAPPVTFNIGGRTLGVAARDLNGDAQPDLVVAHSLNNRVPVSPPPAPRPAAAAPPRRPSPPPPRPRERSRSAISTAMAVRISRCRRSALNAPVKAGRNRHHRAARPIRTVPRAVSAPAWAKPRCSS